MKPIEKGCRAVVVSSIVPSNNGKIVRVGSFIGAREDYEGVDWWGIDKSLPDNIGVCDKTMRECRLQRIDDDDVALGSWEELADIWQPAKELAV